MSAVSINEQPDSIDASIAAKKILDDATLSQIKNSDALKDLDSVEIAQLLSVLHGAFGGDETAFINHLKEVASSKDFSAREDEFKVALKEFLDGFEVLAKKIKKHPEAYLPNLCIDGKVSAELVAKYLKEQEKKLEGQLKNFEENLSSPASTSTAPATETPTTTTTTGGKGSSSYLAMAEALGNVSNSEGWIQALITQNSADQSKLVSKECDAQIGVQTQAVKDMNEQIAKIEAQKRHADRMRKRYGILVHVMTAVTITLSIMTCNPILIAATVSLAVDQETALAVGYDPLQKATNYVAIGYENMGMSKQAAKIYSDMLFTALFAGLAALGGGGNLAMGALVGMMAMQATGTFNDIATAVIDGQHMEGEEADQTRMAIEITGAVLVGIASMGAMAYAGPAASAADAAKTAAEEAAAAAKAAADAAAEATVAGTEEAILAAEEAAQIARTATAAADKAAKVAESVEGGKTSIEKMLDRIQTQISTMYKNMAPTSLQRVMTYGLYPALLATDMGAQIGMGTMKALLAENEMITAKLQKEVSEEQANLDWSTSISSQLSATIQKQTDIASQEVSTLADGVETVLYNAAIAANSTVIKA